MRPVTLMQPLTDLTVCEGDIAQLEVKFSQENVEGSWTKSGQPIAASDRVHIVIDKQIHKLLIEDAKKDDFGVYSFVAPDHDISTSAKLAIQCRSFRHKLFSKQVAFQNKISQCMFFFLCHSYWHFSTTEGHILH